MPSVTVGDFRNSGILLNGPNQFATITDNARIYLSLESITIASSNTNVTNFGFISVDNDVNIVTNAIVISGSQQNVAIRNFGTITAGYTAVFTGGSAAQVVLSNQGIVTSRQTAVFDAGFLTLNNDGVIQGNVAVRPTGSATIVNGGVIEGIAGAILAANGSVSIRNSGTIRGEIDLSAHGDDLRNFGTISGNVLLFGGDDIYDSRAGTHIGAVFGGEGNDVLIGGSGSSELFGENGDDQLFAINTITTTGGILRGGAGNDELNGAAGDDLLDPGTGADIVIGGAGTDFVQYLAASGAVTVDLSGETANAGEAADDTINEVEVVQGSLFNDILIGNGFSNSLQGFAGDDRLDGRTGTDWLRGGIGNDTYVVDSNLDRVIEWANQGTDTVLASVSFRLIAQVSVELLATSLPTGTAAINLTGNAGAQTITGNDGPNTLLGLGASDRLEGRGGNDRLDGGDSPDVLVGGSGADRFVLRAGGSFDVIADFIVADDTIEISASLLGLAAGALSPTRFRVGSAALDADDRLFYDPTIGQLFADLNGNTAGGTSLLATLPTRPTGLTSADFLLI